MVGNGLKWSLGTRLPRDLHWYAKNTGFCTLNVMISNLVDFHKVLPRKIVKVFETIL